ncbi:hypothetical protein [Nereida sp. MMG025]|uniref:hypothetical protein n=1 Tax=Nereida sp. MMG025 TaxID=2909981 RepID=UPI001F38E765|nr:hypothetical protein [Nereida sp. MMG025]MCF6444492.1 hypothetical protein [Nereida sp. MMG025]
MTHPFRRIAYTGALLVLGACTSVVPSTAAKLGMVHPMTADPANFAVRLELPPRAGVMPNSAVLALTSARSDTGQSIERAYTLHESPTLDGARIYKISRSDIEDMRKTQATVQQWEAENPSANKGSLSVALQGCIIGEGPQADDTVDVSLQIEPDGRFLPLIRNAKWRTVVAQTKLGTPEQCPAPAQVDR